MASIEAAREAIYGQFLNNFTAIPSENIRRDNVELENTPEAAPWCELVVRHISAEQESLGAVGQRKFRRIGTISVNIYVPTNTGLSQTDAIVQDVIDSLEALTLPGQIRLNIATARESGINGAWFVTVVETEFEYSETR
jgi:hypothetical protein